MQRLRTFTGLLTGAAFLLLATGCGTAAQPAAPATAPDAGAAAPSGPVTPKVNRLIVAMPAPSQEGNVPGWLGTPSIVALKASYEYVATVDDKTGKFTPELATEWKLEPDGKSYRFQVRKGVMFHRDFGELTAKDITFTIKDIGDEKSQHAYAGDYRTLIASTEEPNPYEAVFNLTRPDAAFISNISHQLSGGEIHSFAERQKLGAPAMADKASAGTGPYQYKERQQGAWIRFERVSFKHWRVQPDFPELELRWVGEPSTRLAGVLTGEIHLAPIPNDLQAQGAKAGMKIATGAIPGVRLFMRFRGAYLADLKDPSKGPKFPDSPWWNVNVRRALNKAVNREELSKTLFGGKTETLILNHYHQGSRKGWNPEWEKKFPEAYGFDPAKAKDLLAQAGYGPTKPLQVQLVLVNLAEVPNTQDVEEAIGNYWKQAGVQVQLVTIDRAEDTRKTNAQEWVNAVDIFAAPSDQFTGVWVFNTYFNRPYNGNAVHIPEIDTLFQRVRAELDETKQDALWRQLGDLLFDAVQQVPLYWLPVEVMYNPTIVAGYTFPGSTSGLYTKLETIKAAR